MTAGIAVDDAGQAHVTGVTDSPNFPTTGRAVQPAHGGGFDAFVTKLDTTPGRDDHGDNDHGDDDHDGYNHDDDRNDDHRNEVRR